MPGPDEKSIRALWDDGQRATALRTALENWDDVLDGGGDLHWLARALRVCGADAAALSTQVHMARRREGDADSWLPLIRSIHHSGDPWWALELLDCAAVETRDARTLQVEASLAIGADVSTMVAQWLQDYRDAAAHEAAMSWLVASGRICEAEDLLQRVAGVPVWRARLALWRMRPDLAREDLAQLPPSPQASILKALASLQEGDARTAEAALRSLADSADSPESVQCEARSWLATILRVDGRYEEATRAADEANKASPQFTLGPRLERELAVEHSTDGARRRDRESFLWRLFGRHRQRGRTIGDLEYAHLLDPLGVEPEEAVIPGLEKAIERLGGNRTAYPTILEDGVLLPLRLPLDPRHHGATIQRVLWTRGVDAVRRLYREFEPEVGGHPLSRIYQGEIDLWVGEYAGAEKIFREVIAQQRRTLWAWIGLGASRMFQGDFQQALEVWEEGVAITHFEGPTLFVFRGECHRRLGMRDQARRDLETAIEQKPQRLSARINLALLDGSGAALQRSIEECYEFAPILMEQLEGDAAERLEQVLAAMRGNRSSSPDIMMYHLWGQIWRRARP